MKVQLLRHATLLVTMNGRKILVDPMLGKAETMPPIVNSSNDKRNPLVDLTITIDFQQEIDGVLLTHTHRDHLDDAAIAQLPRKLPVLCQPADEEKLKELGFLQVDAIADVLRWEGITIHRTLGQHGTGEIGARMAPVSGYVLTVPGEPSLYIAGDTIYCEEVYQAVTLYQPSVIVVNAGGARFNTGDAITMTAADVEKVCRVAADKKIIAVHMDAINHCLVSREDLRSFLEQEKLSNQVYIPADGESLIFL